MVCSHKITEEYDNGKYKLTYTIAICMNKQKLTICTFPGLKHVFWSSLLLGKGGKVQALGFLYVL